MSTLKLNSGFNMPVIGLGTWKVGYIGRLLIETPCFAWPLG